MALGNAGARWDSGPRHGQLRPCNAECPLSFRHSLETYGPRRVLDAPRGECCDGKKGSQDTRRVVSRHAEGHLLCGEEDLDRASENGEGGASGRTQIMKEYKGSPALAAGLLAAAQAVEHYEISR